MAEISLQFPVDVIRNNNQESVYYGKMYATSRLRGTLSTEGLAEHIAAHGSIVTKEVILLVLNQFQKCIPELLCQGWGVQLNGLGTFWPRVSAVGKPKNDISQMKELGIEECITGVKMNFTPVNEKLFSLASKALKAKCSFVWGNYIRMDYIEPAGKPKQIIPTLIPLDTFEDYIANGGKTSPQKLDTTSNP